MNETILFVVVPIVLVLLVVWGLENSPAKRKLRAELEKRTQLVKCWIVIADQGLYNGTNEVGGPARVVFTLEKDVDNADQRLKEIAMRLSEGNQSFHVNESDFGKSDPVLMKWTNGLKAFTTVVWVSPSHLPGRRLTQPYLMCKVCVSDQQEPMAGASMVSQT